MKFDEIFNWFDIYIKLTGRFYWIFVAFKFNAQTIAQSRCIDRNAGMDFYQINPPENSANEICVYSKENNYDLESFFESSDVSLI